MKKTRRTAILAAVAAMLLSACSNAVNGRVDSGEIVVPEMSSEDLLVSSLEYLLQDDGDTKKEAEEQTEPDTSQEEVVPETQGEQFPADDTVPEAEEEAVIYYGNAGSFDLNQEIIQIEEKTAEELLDALAKHNIVSLDTKVLSFEMEETGEEILLYLDLSKAMSEYLKTMSKEAESIILASVTNTFLENFEADSICITVNGKILITKHAEYAEPLHRCTPKELLARTGASADDDLQRDQETGQDTDGREETAPEEAEEIEEQEETEAPVDEGTEEF